MEQIQKLQGLSEAGPAPASLPLEREHDDADILDGCPRTMVINGVKIAQRAFVNREFSQFATIFLYLGFGTCRTEEEVDEMTITDIFNSIAMQSVVFGDFMPGDNIEEVLYDFMKPEDGVLKPSFVSIQRADFERFMAIIIEQNNLLKLARANAKKNIRTLGTLSILSAGS